MGGLKCASCSKNIGRYGDYLDCSDSCQGNFHIACVNVSEEEFVEMNKSGAVKHWKCNRCSKSPESGNQFSSASSGSAASIGSAISKDLSPCGRCSGLVDLFSVAIADLERKFMASLECFKRDIVNDLRATLEENLQDLPDKVHENVRDVVASHLNVPTTSSVTTSAGAAAAKASVIIKPRDEKQSTTVTKSDLLQRVNPVASGVSVSKIKHIKGGGLVIGCNSAESAAKLRKEADDKLAEKYTVKEAKLIRPRLKIVGITEDHDKEDLVNFLKVQNESVFSTESKLEVVSFEALKHKNNSGDGRRRRQIFQCIIEVDIRSYRSALSSGQVFVGYDGCSVYDAVEVRRCFNCSGFNHTSSNCKQKIACPRCSGDHAVTDCKSETLKCINCFNVHKTSPDTAYNHAAWDRGCRVYQHKLKLFKTDILGFE